MSQKVKLSLKNIEKYLAFLLLVLGCIYLYPYLNCTQIPVKIWMLMLAIQDIAILELWEVVREKSQKHKNKENNDN